MRKTHLNSRGSVLMQVLIATAIMSLGFYFLSDYVIAQKKQIGKTVNAVNLRFALNSAMDYVLFGLRQKYCFTDDDLMMNATTDECNLVHSGSVERLIMSDDQVSFILQQIASGTDVGPVDKDNIPLDRINRYIKIESATTAHPLFTVLQNLKSVRDEITGQVVKVDGFSVDLERDDTGYLPRAGREVYVKATIALKIKKGDSSVVTIGSTPLKVTSQIAIYPREVGSFALLVPKDLRLDKSWDADAETGDVALHMFKSKNEVGGGGGLNFLSPVFVNQDIYLPADSSSPKDRASYNGGYAAVTFADRVYLGNGWVKNPDGTQFEPRTSGGAKDRYWSDLPTFGGFLRGIENDGGLDKGLQVFGKVISGSTVDSSLMSKCIERSQHLSSSTNLYKSELAAKLRDSSEGEFNYRLFLDAKNEFVGQENAIRNVDIGDFGEGTAKRTGSTGNPIMNLTFMHAKRSVTAQLTATSELTIVPEVASAAYRQILESQVASSETAVSQAKESLESYKNQLSADETELSRLQGLAADETSKPTEPSPTPIPSPDPDLLMMTPTPAPEGYNQDPELVANLQSQIEALQKSVAKLRDVTIPAQESAVTSADAAVLKAKQDLEFISEPPRIKIEVEPIYSRYGIRKDRVEITIKVSRADRLLNQDGQLEAPSIGILAYDGTYHESAPIKSPANDKLLRYLNFSLKSGGGLVAPKSMSVTTSSGLLPLSAEDETDYAELDVLCEEARNAAASQSFGGASWNVDFSGTTRSSWNFAGDSSSALGADPILDKTLVLDAGADGVFRVYSIVKECVIASSANLITGFYTCDTLRIESRTKPLRIIGSFIVGALKIDPEAYKAGIIWSSIYHPQAAEELRAAGVLKTVAGGTCTAPKNPIWHPIPSIQETADRRACNVISLRGKADPFQWTTVDPDCGLLKGKSNTSCKRRLVRFFVVEHAREGGR